MTSNVSAGGLTHRRLAAMSANTDTLGQGSPFGVR